MPTGMVTWSKTPASNDVIDSAAQFAEGQAPSSLNDGIRGAMSSAAKWRDDVAGVVLVTTGSGTAYVLATNQVFAANNNGNTVQFTPNVTNTGAVTLACDGQAALPLRFLTGTDLPAGVLISGSLYQATLRSSEYLLHASPLAQPFLIPLGGSVDYWGTTAPNSNFALMQGQAISRTTYAPLFSLIGTTYGVGDGSSTFNIPDLVGRVTAMLDAGSSRLSATYFGTSPAVLGARGGLESASLTIANIASFTPTVSSYSLTFTSGNTAVATRNISATTGASDLTHLSAGNNAGTDAGSTNWSATGNIGGSIAMSALGSNTPHNNVQPTIICNKIMRVL